MNESQNVEWKRSWCDEYLKWTCGFANAQGGVLEIGRAAPNCCIRTSSRVEPERAIEVTTQEIGDTTQEIVGTTQEVEATTQENDGATTQERILALLEAEPGITRRLLAERIGITPDGVKYHLDKLRAAGIIRHVGATKAGRWEVLQ